MGSSTAGSDRNGHDGDGGGDGERNELSRLNLKPRDDQLTTALPSPSLQSVSHTPRQSQHQQPFGLSDIEKEKLLSRIRFGLSRSNVSPDQSSTDHSETDHSDPSSSSSPSSPLLPPHLYPTTQLDQPIPNPPLGLTRPPLDPFENSSTTPSRLLNEEEALPQLDFATELAKVSDFVDQGLTPPRSNQNTFSNLYYPTTASLPTALVIQQPVFELSERSIPFGRFIPSMSPELASNITDELLDHLLVEKVHATSVGKASSVCSSTSTVGSVSDTGTQSGMESEGQGDGDLVIKSGGKKARQERVRNRKSKKIKVADASSGNVQSQPSPVAETSEAASESKDVKIEWGPIDSSDSHETLGDVDEKVADRTGHFIVDELRTPRTLVITEANAVIVPTDSLKLSPSPIHHGNRKSPTTPTSTSFLTALRTITMATTAAASSLGTALTTAFPIEPKKAEKPAGSQSREALLNMLVDKERGGEHLDNDDDQPTLDASSAAKKKKKKGKKKNKKNKKKKGKGGAVTDEGRGQQGEIADEQDENDEDSDIGASPVERAPIPRDRTYSAKAASEDESMAHSKTGGGDTKECSPAKVSLTVKKVDPIQTHKPTTSVEKRMHGSGHKEKLESPTKINQSSTPNTPVKLTSSVTSPVTATARTASSLLRDPVTMMSNSGGSTTVTANTPNRGKTGAWATGRPSFFTQTTHAGPPLSESERKDSKMEVVGHEDTVQVPTTPTYAQASTAVTATSVGRAVSVSPSAYVPPPPSDRWIVHIGALVPTSLYADLIDEVVKRMGFRLVFMTRRGPDMNVYPIDVRFQQRSSLVMEIQRTPTATVSGAKAISTALSNFVRDAIGALSESERSRLRNANVEDIARVSPVREGSTASDSPKRMPILERVAARVNHARGFYCAPNTHHTVFVCARQSFGVGILRALVRERKWSVLGIKVIEELSLEHAKTLTPYDVGDCNWKGSLSVFAPRAFGAAYRCEMEQCEEEEEREGWMLMVVKGLNGYVEARRVIDSYLESYDAISRSSATAPVQPSMLNGRNGWMRDGDVRLGRDERRGLRVLVSRGPESAFGMMTTFFKDSELVGEVFAAEDAGSKLNMYPEHVEYCGCAWTAHLPWTLTSPPPLTSVLCLIKPTLIRHLGRLLVRAQKEGFILTGLKLARVTPSLARKLVGTRADEYVGNGNGGVHVRHYHLPVFGHAGTKVSAVYSGEQVGRFASEMVGGHVIALSVCREENPVRRWNEVIGEMFGGMVSGGSVSGISERLFVGEGLYVSPSFRHALMQTDAMFQEGLAMRMRWEVDHQSQYFRVGERGRPLDLPYYPRQLVTLSDKPPAPEICAAMLISAECAMEKNLEGWGHALDVLCGDSGLRVVAARMAVCSDGIVREWIGLAGRRDGGVSVGAEGEGVNVEKAMQGGPTLVLALEGDNAVERVKSLVCGMAGSIRRFVDVTRTLADGGRAVPMIFWELFDSAYGTQQQQQGRPFDGTTGAMIGTAGGGGQGQRQRLPLRSATTQLQAGGQTRPGAGPGGDGGGR
ncbi:hypothetical protein BJ742DRAFT_822950 [Cladochytrium replicatum]|nr:hypothetical protein BJ742DRAFT_822950 [Cladochytrium replicatum]